jgi:histidine triad (HIT) family protein
MKTDPDCLFCKIVAGEIPAHKVYEDEDFVCFLDIGPVNLGHTLIVPREHCQNIFDMPLEIAEKLGPVIQKTARAVAKATEATGVNVGMNNGLTAGQLVHHAHVHIIPRFQGDGHVGWSNRKDVEQKDFEEMRERVKKGFEN